MNTPTTPSSSTSPTLSALIAAAGNGWGNYIVVSTTGASSVVYASGGADAVAAFAKSYPGHQVSSVRRQNSDDIRAQQANAPTQWTRWRND